MLHRLLKNVKGMNLAAQDGELGRVTDVYFDDAEWTCRYLVVKTGSWLSLKHVLVSPHAIQGIDWARGEVQVSLTREQIRSSPDIDADKPVTRQNETTYFDYYGYPRYWAGPYVWGPYPTTFVPPVGQDAAVVDQTMQEALDRRAREREQYDPHLRSAQEVTGYRIGAVDGALGELDDLLFDEADWSLRFLLIDTRKWLPGRHVVVPVDRVDDVSWGKSAVAVKLTKDEVRSSPEFDPDVTITAAREANLYAHYGQHSGVSAKS